MKAVYFFLGSMFIFSGWAIAQSTGPIPSVIRATNTLERLSYGAVGNNPGSLIPTMPMEKPQIEGERYLNKHWNRAAILLYNNDNLYEGNLVKYDVLGNELDVMVRDQMGKQQVIHGTKVKSFVWVDSVSNKAGYFLNGNEYTDENGIAFQGFFEILMDGEPALLKKTDTEVLKSNYNVALGVGNKNHQIIQNQRYYFSNGKVVRPIPNSMAKFLKVWPDKQKEMAEFVKINRLGTDKIHHLEAFFNHYYSLKK